MYNYALCSVCICILFLSVLEDDVVSAKADLHNIEVIHTEIILLLAR